MSIITNSKLRKAGRVIIDKDTREAAGLEVGDILRLEITIEKKTKKTPEK